MGKTKEEKQDETFMVKVATFIVDRRNLFFLLFILMILFSIVSMNWVKVENELSTKILFETLMGPSVPPRRKWLLEHSEEASDNLW